MNVDACRSRPRRCLRRGAACAFVHAGYHVFSVRARSGFAGLKRGKVKLEPFLIFNQQFLTLIRAGLPILGSLQMLAKNQKNAHFARSSTTFPPRQDGESLSAAFEAQTGFPSCTPPPCWPANAPAICRK